MPLHFATFLHVDFLKIGVETSCKAAGHWVLSAIGKLFSNAVFVAPADRRAETAPGKEKSLPLNSGEPIDAHENRVLPKSDKQEIHADEEIAKG